MQAEDDPMPLKPTRASFVRGLPESMPIEEVIERGKEAGIQLNPSDVHSARYYMRQEALAKMSSRPVTQLVLPGSVGRVSPAVTARTAPAAQAKPDAAPTNILGLRAANGGKERVEAKTRRAPPPAPAPAPAKKQRGKPAPAHAPSLPPVKLNGSLEAQLRQIVMRIGTERARRIIEQIEEIRV